MNQHLHSFQALAVKIFLLFLLFFLFSGFSPALHAQVMPPTPPGVDGVQNKDPGSELWRQVRQRQAMQGGRTQVRGVESAMLINPQGERWSQFRMENLAVYGKYPLLVVIALIVVFFLFRGKVYIEGGLSGQKVFRFTHYERALHWTMAIIFIFLGITGLILLFGRSMLIPVFGKEVFSILASMSKEGHNLFGPLFGISVLLMLFQFVRRNIYAKGDLTWLLRGGGFFGKEHVTGGFFNMGEKTWYWIFILVGLAVSVSGLILVFPNFGQGRVIMELSHVVHGIGAIILITVAIGHMYLGSSLGTEGTVDGMKTGYVDIRWAEEHHDRWAKECRDNNKLVSPEDYARIRGEAVVQGTTGNAAAAPDGKMETQS